MRNFITLINLCIIFGITTALTRLEEISKEFTDAREEVKAPTTSKTNTKSVRPKLKNSNSTMLAKMETTVDESAVDFIREMAQARMLDLEEGKIAAQRCTSRGLKDYGSLIMRDQSKMLDELKALAVIKNISLDESLSTERSEDLKALKKLHGKSFDKKFVKMMMNDHKRDIRIFNEATRYQDADVQVFATKYLPVIESHFNKIRSLKK